jgi:oxalate decarboxylase/phosphoglucose isomerase-like protein (cupin superfamily)
MKHATKLFVPLGLVVCLLAVAGCATKYLSVGTGDSPKPFVMGLEDPCDYHLLLTGTPQTFGMRSGRVRLTPGKSIGLHNTKGNEELLVFLSGSGVAQIGQDIRLPVGAGKAAYIPPQTAHNILNTGTEPLMYVFCVAPAGPRR